MTWKVKQRISVLGAPVLLIYDDEGHEVSIGLFDYPNGRRKVRVEVKSQRGIFRAAATATRFADATRARMVQLEDFAGHSIAVARSKENDSVIVDVEGKSALEIALPYFGDDITAAFHA